jgi:putative hydrolase of the HAD superfamily
MRYPFVLLDVGETMVGPARSFGAVYAEVLSSLGEELPEAELERCMRETWREYDRLVPAGADRYAHFPGGEREYWLRFTASTLRKALGAEPTKELANDMLNGLREAFRSASVWQVYSDVVPALRALRKAGVSMGVVSNWDSNLPRLLDKLHLTEYFDACAVSHLEGIEKPDPELFRCALRSLGAPSENSLHVGDLPELDLAGANAAGVDCVLVDRKGRLDATHRPLSSLEKLPVIAREGLDGSTLP